MKILLDECFPEELTSDFAEYDAIHIKAMGWSGLTNGNLLKAAEDQFDVFISIDTSIPSQQNFRRYDLAFVLIRVFNNRVETIRNMIQQVKDVLTTVEPGTVTWIPEPPRNWE